MSSESTSRPRSVPVKQQSLHSKTDLQKDRHRQSQLHDFDVLVQAGQLSETSAAGNQNFQHLVHLNIALYDATKSRTERYYITQSIVRSIRHEGGRFLQYVSAWPRHHASSSSSDHEKTPAPDDSIWILKEMTDEQAETFTGKALDETIQNKQQQQHQQQQQRSQDTSLGFINNHDHPNHPPSPQHVNPRHKIEPSSSSGHRKPFRVLQPQISTPSLEQEKPSLLQESRIAESEYGNDLDVRQGTDENGILDDAVNNQENNPLLVGNHGTTPASISSNFPPSPPVALMMMPSKAATWTVSPIRNQRKRLRVDAFGDSPPPSPSTVPRLPPMKRCRCHCDD